MHIRPGDHEIAERGHSIFPAISIAFGYRISSNLPRFGIQSVVSKGNALEQRAAVAMATIRPILLTARIVFGMKQLKSALLLFGELGRSRQNAIKLRFVRNLRQQKLF